MREGQARTIRTASMRARVIGRYRIFVHNQQAPRDDEWNEVLELFRSAPRLDDVCALVHTEGGAPNVSQRRQLNDLLGKGKPRIAVMTPSAVARAAGTALAWFNPRIRILRPEEFETALDHLEATGEDRIMLRKSITDLRAELRQDAGMKTNR